MVDASSVPAGRAESDLRAALTSGTDQGNGEDPAVLSGRAAHKMSDWGRPPRQCEAGRGVRASAWRVNNLLNNSKEPRGRECAACGSVRVDQVWEYPEEYIVDDGGRNGHDGWRPVENKGEFNVCMPSGFPADVEPPPQIAADVERWKCKAAS